jgi:hypothetical protein
VVLEFGGHAITSVQSHVPLLLLLFSWVCAVGMVIIIVDITIIIIIHILPIGFDKVKINLFITTTDLLMYFITTVLVHLHIRDYVAPPPHQHEHCCAIPGQNDPTGHARQLAEKALVTLPNVPMGQLQLLKVMLPEGETEGGGHTTAADEPATQKLLAGHTTLVLLDVHRLPAGQVVTAELPASQNIPTGQVVTFVDPAAHTVPFGHRS